MRELMIALIVACTLISVAEAFYMMVTPANANFTRRGDRWSSYRTAPQHEEISVGASTAALTQRRGRMPRYLMLRSCGCATRSRHPYVEHAEGHGDKMFACSLSAWP
jgi:hypothetical protein